MFITLHQPDNTVDGDSTLAIYRNQVVIKCSDIHGEPLGVDKDEIVDLFRRIVGPFSVMDNI